MYYTISVGGHHEKCRGESIGLQLRSALFPGGGQGRGVVRVEQQVNDTSCCFGEHQSEFQRLPVQPPGSTPLQSGAPSVIASGEAWTPSASCSQLRRAAPGVPAGAALTALAKIGWMVESHSSPTRALLCNDLADGSDVTDKIGRGAMGRRTAAMPL